MTDLTAVPQCILKVVLCECVWLVMLYVWRLFH